MRRSENNKEKKGVSKRWSFQASNNEVLAGENVTHETDS